MYTVIIADDEKIIRESLKNEINWSDLGFKIESIAANGMEALELVEEYQPDLLITDIQMPYISGIDLARRVREINPFMDIVFLTAYEEFTYAQKAIKYNVISYLLKTQSKEELEDELLKIKNKLDEKYSLRTIPYTATKRILDKKRKNILKDIFLNQLSNQEINEKLLQLEFNKKNNTEYTLMLIESDELNTALSNETTENIINDILEKYVQFAFTSIDNKILIFISDNQETVRHYKQLIADEILQGLQKILKIKVRICISQPFLETSKLIDSYNRMFLTNERKIENPIIYAEDINLQTPALLCQKAMEIIEKEYGNSYLSVIDISERLHISTCYLSILLKKTYSSSFVKLLTTKRMEAAKNYLLNTNLKIMEISELCGYNDQHYFSYCFKRYYGISPKKIRESNDV